MTKSLLNIALLGMNEKNASTFSYFIKKHAGNHFQLSTADNADAFLIDFDNDQGIRQWHQFCGGGRKASLIISTDNPAKPRSLWLNKPVTSQGLEVAIAKLVKLVKEPVASAYAHAGTPSPNAHKESHAPRENHLHVVHDATREAVKATETEAGEKPVKGKAGYERTFSDESSPNLTLTKEEIAECCGSQGDADPAVADFRTKVSYDDDKTLLGALRKAIAIAKDKHCAVEIQNMHAQMVVMPGGEKTFFELGNHRVRHICAMPLLAMPVLKPLPLSAMECERLYPAHHKYMHSMEEVLWQIALWTSRGRVPKALDPNHPMRLAFWPNFTRLQITPHAVHITALWTRHSLSPVQVAQNLGISQRYVFALASAAHAIGAVEVTEKQEGRVVETGWKKSHGLFSSILRSLKLAS